ncbi:MAG TPA: hypothetical protein VMK12_20350, partial [Anaeromyxobacteraceae bacterium]|nr:hypothetical protein [Anaeromyxobacteraceae bacterium]
ETSARRCAQPRMRPAFLAGPRRTGRKREPTCPAWRRENCRHCGTALRDGAGLLKAWARSGERTAVRVTPYFAPNTRTEALAAAEKASRAAGVSSVFTLASALLPPEAFVSGLAHGVYVSGDLTPLEEALQLEHATPHNFIVLRADPAADTVASGIYAFTRTLSHGQGVALPQLTVDFLGVGGRGGEQAERLIDLYAKNLPPPEIEP